MNNKSRHDGVASNPSIFSNKPHLNESEVTQTNKLGYPPLSNRSVESNDLDSSNTSLRKIQTSTHSDIESSHQSLHSRRSSKLSGRGSVEAKKRGSGHNRRSERRRGDKSSRRSQSKSKHQPTDDRPLRNRNMNRSSSFKKLKSSLTSSLNNKKGLSNVAALALEVSADETRAVKHQPDCSSNKDHVQKSSSRYRCSGENKGKKKRSSKVKPKHESSGHKTKHHSGERKTSRKKRKPKASGGQDM